MAVFSRHTDGDFLTVHKAAELRGNRRLCSVLANLDDFLPHLGEETWIQFDFVLESIVYEAIELACDERFFIEEQPPVRVDQEGGLMTYWLTSLVVTYSAVNVQSTESWI